MRDIFFTILIIWVLWRIFSGLNKSRGSFTFNNQNNNYAEPPKQEGDITIDTRANAKNKKNKDDEGEYVDYEEIK